MDQQAQPATEPLGESWQNNSDYNRAADFLGVNVYDRRDFKIAKKIAALSDWAEHKTGKKDVNSILTEVARLQRTIGSSVVGKTLVDQLYQNMRISQDTKRLVEKEKTMEQSKASEKKVNPIQKTVAETVNKVV